ncbi:MAG: GldG family protein [Gammaproteobacteria bacterium]
MPISHRTGMRAQTWILAVLIVALAGLAAYLSTQYRREIDLTASGRNTLSQASVAVLAALKDPVKITAFARPDGQTREEIRRLVSRYQAHKPDLELRFLDPDAVPDLIRDQGITQDGELVVSYGKRREHVQNLTEQALTNVLQTVGRGGERYIAFIAGHGERDPLGEKNQDVGVWGRQLESRGFKITTVDLSAAGVPDNTSVLVLASPQVDLLPGEVEALKKWIDQGGNLLWLAEPGADRGLAPLAQHLGVQRVPGTVVDPVARALGVDDPTFAVVTQYQAAAVLDDFRFVTVFPIASGLKAADGGAWQVTPLLSTTEHAWSETGPLEGEIRYDEGADTKGPIELGLALTRDRPGEGKDGDADAAPAQQRVIVIGDGDFLANSYLGNGGNLDLGLRMANWLARDEQFIKVPARTAADLTLDLPERIAYPLAVWFLLLCPLALVGTGIVVWRRRRAR